MDATALIDRGFHAVKIKLGRDDPREDYDRIGAVRDAVGPKIRIMTDVNCAWTLNTARFWGGKLADFDVYWLEEPMVPENVKAHAELQQAISIPVAVGETIFTKYAFRDYIEAGAVGIVQADATKLLGIDEWVRHFNYINYIDCFDGEHPNVFVPAEAPHEPFTSIEDINNYLLQHKEVIDLVKRRGGKPKFVFLMFDEETERLAKELGADVWFPRAKLRTRMDNKIETVRVGDMVTKELKLARVTATEVQLNYAVDDSIAKVLTLPPLPKLQEPGLLNLRETSEIRTPQIQKQK